MKRPFSPQEKRTLTKQEKSRMGMAHFTHEEMQGFISMQGEQITDSETNLPAFPELSAVFKNPKIRQIFKEVRDLAGKDERVPMVVQRIVNNIQKKTPLYDEETPKSPLGRKIKGNDIGKDTQIALMPLDVLSFFDDLRGYIKKNPRDGLPMYFAEWLSAAAAIGGLGLQLFGGDDDDSGEQGRRWQERRDQMSYERYLDEKREREKHREEAGYNKGFDTTPVPLDKQWQGHLTNPYKHSHMKTGGLVGKPIKGRGNGQSDDIKVDSTKEGEWIWDASTVADLGDGATDAGWKEIRRLEETVKKTPGFKDMHEFKPGMPPRIVKTALSNGEYRTPTKIVTAIGDGDNAKGADVLRTMTEEIRRYKNSNGDKLPPPIKDPIQFFKKAVHQARGS